MIEIPGYRLLRQLGRGGMATVYLAVQESVDREVAIKVMSPALLVDPNFGERFQREAKIAARLHHRHVVGIHDVGRVGEHHYIAMEYLSGGPVLSKDGPPRSVSFALRVAREIAGAINYAQQKGFIHRDIKPDNILLRDDGSAALTDFGIARANDSATRMTRTGAVVGTPHYMSPEQARGKQLDGRADLYSLGVVLYELLVGRVPYNAEDSLAVGIMHITEPVPRLPESLAVLQPLVDGLLAKEPHDRFQTGNEAALAIARYEQAIANGELPQLASAAVESTRPATLPETSVSPLPLREAAQSGSVRHRSDPSIGRLSEIMAATDDHILRASRASRRPARGKRRGGWLGFVLASLAVLVLLAGFMAWKHQDWLRSLLPNTELNDTLARAQRALDAGRLDGTQGDSARELFQQARALDPDNDIARRGLQGVGERQLALAREALERKDFDAAGNAVKAARELLGGGLEVEKVERLIVDAQSQGAASEAALVAAQAALDAGRILGADGAVEQFQRILVGDPANALARAGISRSVDVLAAQARAAFAANDLDAAAARIEDIARILPAFPALPDLRAELGSRRDAAATAIDDDLAKVDARLGAGRLEGAGDSADALLESVLSRDPANPRALARKRRLALAMVEKARTAIGDGEPGVAQRLLERAERLAPELEPLRSARIELRELRERRAIESERPAATAADLARMQGLIKDAELAVEAGRLITPPGNSAYDKYRAALAIDGNNLAAQEGLKRLPTRARDLFDQHLRANELKSALDMYEVVRQTAPGDPALPAMAERLATAFLDLAEQSIVANRRADAQRALSAARKLSPANPRLATLDARAQALPAEAG